MSVFIVNITLHINITCSSSQQYFNKYAVVKGKPHDTTLRRGHMTDDKLPHLCTRRYTNQRKVHNICIICDST